MRLPQFKAVQSKLLKGWQSGLYKTMSVDKKMLPTKTCTLKSKDQGRKSLARQKILQTITVVLHQKNCEPASTHANKTEWGP